MEKDTRWIQRFSNFRKAFGKLNAVAEVVAIHDLSDLEKEGLIQRFEYTHELAWNVMKDFFEFEGNTAIMGSRSATRLAFENGVITDGEGWMDMIRSRNLTSHTYNEATADEIVFKIINIYNGLFRDFEAKMTGFVDMK
ncbi:nucleotidyltransferase substrate binding protein [Dyadobacter sp. NIV53]|uniref:nucleotidyltransferase substrate binding protein n=1 Tax=Dyadobacter sp. NIV53 TaxID=2861765 RepID=UPI001C8861E8|nr:nucleotidyltransferase substrate binding protein [Dyadobacter sp. NIV53]